MTFAAPAARAVATKATGRAAARAGAAKAGAKATAKAAGKATTAKGRGAELLAGGMSREDAARVLRDEFGSTLAEARSVLPPEDGPTPQITPSESQEPGRPAEPSPPAGRQVPRLPAGGAGSTVGGLVLGVLAWAVGLTFLRSGPEGVTALLRAKFLNQVSPEVGISPGPRSRSWFGKWPGATS